jgi:ribosomal protein S18 acetylase RimI-like enzyme
MSTIRALKPDDLGELERLFASFPHKRAQQRFQGIDGERLAAFFAQGARRQLERDDGPLLRVIDTGHGLSGFGALHADAWHSRFYPGEFGRIAPYLVHEADAADRAALLDALLAGASERGLGHLSVRIDGAEYGALETLQQAGFRLVDVSVKMSARLRDVPVLAAPSRAQGMQIRPYAEGDLAAVRRIASGSHPFNHYYNDPALARSGTDALFEAWVERCCTGLAKHVFVLEHRGRVRGFAIYLRPGALNDALGVTWVVLDFVVIETDARGGGVGRWLVSQTLEGLASEYDMVELRTSHTNTPALACYHDLNMRSVSTDFALHRHA